MRLHPAVDMIFICFRSLHTCIYINYFEGCSFCCLLPCRMQQCSLRPSKNVLDFLEQWFGTFETFGNNSECQISIIGSSVDPSREFLMNR